MGADDLQGVANLDPREIIGRIFSCFSHFKPMADNDAPGTWPTRTPGAW